MLLRRIRTFLLIDFTWIFFRSKNLTEALHIVKKIIFEFHGELLFSNKCFLLFENAQKLFNISISILILIIVDVMRYKNYNIHQLFFSQSIVFRWICYVSIVMAIIFMGYYGHADTSTQFIYFQF